METQNKKEYRFDDKKHLHTLGGKPLTGVTTVLGVVSKGDGLIQWSANEAIKYVFEHSEERYNEEDEVCRLITFSELAAAKTAWKITRDTAGTQGTDVHALIEEIIKDSIKNSDGFIRTGKNPNQQVQNFIDWSIHNRIKFLESEKNIWSEELWIGGIVDFVCQIGDDVFVGDIKTSKQIYPTNYWQTSAYQFCLQEMGLYPKIKGFKVIRLGKDGSFEVGENYAYDDNISGFKSALNVYRKLNLITK